MKLYGYRTFIRSEVSARECGNCHNSEQIHTTERRFFQIFGIPVFPAGELRVTRCLHCLKEKRAVTGRLPRAKGADLSI